MRRILVAGLFAFGLCVAAGTGQEKKGGGADPKMDAMMKAAAVGEQHKMLAGLREGDWKLTVEMWMDPAAPSMKSPASSTIKSVMGGRFLEETVKGDFLGMAYEGKGTIGYDNVGKKFENSWLDNMGTGMMHGTGNLCADGKTLTFEAEFLCPWDGSKKVKSRDVYVFASKDKHEMTSFHTLEGKENKVMQITYERVK